MNLAIFDLDNTLLAGDSDEAWPRFLIKKGLLDAELYAEKNQRFYEEYKSGILDIDEFLNFQLAPLARFDRETLDKMHAEYMQDYIRPIMTKKGQAQVKAHQDAGDTVMVISATNRFITAPIVEAFGIAHLIATELEEDANGRFTGKPRGTPSFQDGKIVRLEEWLAAQNLRLSDFERSWFYSDSRNDIPLMTAVTNPVAVDPDDVLRAHAEIQAWEIVSFRD